jgi:isochorismate pyruvate lyase
MTPLREPSIDTPAVRRFKDPSYIELSPTLAGLRQRIDALDEQIVALLAQRSLCVRDATRFKRDSFQVTAPARQAQVFARVRTLAAPHEAGFTGLCDVVESTYRTLVAGYIAGEKHFFNDTELIDP